MFCCNIKSTNDPTISHIMDSYFFAISDVHKSVTYVHRQRTSLTSISSSHSHNTSRIFLAVKQAGSLPVINMLVKSGHESVRLLTTSISFLRFFTRLVSPVESWFGSDAASMIVVIRSKLLRSTCRLLVGCWDGGCCWRRWACRGMFWSKRNSSHRKILWLTITRSFIRIFVTANCFK